MTYLEQLADTIRDCLAEGVESPGDGPDLFLLYAVLLTAKGEAVTNRDVHDAWVAWMLLRGEQHPSMVPFELLDDDIKAEDAPFAAAIRRAASRAR